MRDRMGNLFAELKRRHIYRVAAAYAVVAWAMCGDGDRTGQVLLAKREG